MNKRSTGPLDVLVIGGGQAGLAMGYHLGRRGLRFEIVDAGTEIGQVWAHRWDSLRLFTSSRYDSLPGLPFPAAADTYPSKDEVAAYLQSYAAAFDLPVRLNTSVTSLTRTDGTYVAKAGGISLEARNVVVATGPFHLPFTPFVAKHLSADVHQMHSVDYRRPETLPPGDVLVVGAANSGCQIALELSATRTVELSTGQRLPTVPQRPLGRDVWTWAKQLRLDTITADSRLGRRLAGRDQVIGIGPRRLVRHHGVRLRPRLIGASGQSVTFADGDIATFGTIIWATGFTRDHSWIEIPRVRDEQGQLEQSRGVTPSEGLYTLGLPWQHTRGSALLGWVSEDAAFVADKIESARR